MKNKFLLPILLLLFFSNINAQDQRWQAGSIFNVEKMSIDYTLTNYFDEENQDLTSIHASVGLRLERKWKENWVIQSGLSFSKMKFNPQMYLPFSYGTTFEIDTGDEILLDPLLDQHEVNIFSIPLGIKYNFAPNKRWQPFLSFSINPSFKYQETEIYKEGFDSFNRERKTVHADDPGIDLFNIGFDLEAGIQFKINSFFKVVLAPGIRIKEYRNENEKFKRNRDFLYQSQWLSWTQKKLGVGFLAAF